MHTNGNSPTDVAALLIKLRDEKARIETHIAHTEEVLLLLGKDPAIACAITATGDDEHPLRVNRLDEPSLRGLTLQQAIDRYATAHKPEFRVADLAQRLMSEGFTNWASKESACSSLFYHLRRDPRFVRLAAVGMFRFNTAPETKATRQAKNYPLPRLAQGRNHAYSWQALPRRGRGASEIQWRRD